MMTKKLPVGIESFEEIRKQDFYYVDKTNLIADLLASWGKVNLFTRPRRFGKTLNMSMLKYFFEIGTDSALFETLLAEYNADYAAHCRIETAPYPGVAALLRTLHTQGRKLAIVSNKPDEAVRALRADFFADAVQIAVGETAAIRRKPAPDMLLAAMEQLGADPDKTVFVGDSEVDIATARAADLPCISVLWGFRDRDVLERAGAQQFAADAGELARLLD